MGGQALWCGVHASAAIQCWLWEAEVSSRGEHRERAAGLLGGFSPPSVATTWAAGPEVVKLHLAVNGLGNLLLSPLD